MARGIQNLGQPIAYIADHRHAIPSSLSARRPDDQRRAITAGDIGELTLAAAIP
jgi:hypothetical protein